MIWGILGVFLKSFESIFRKKSLDESRCLKPLAFDFLGSIFGLLIGIVFFTFQVEGYYEYSPKIVFLILLGIIFRLSSSALMQRVYRNEKLSVITPYENTNEIFSILLAFFIFRDVSWTAFFIALLIIVFTLIYSVDFKKLQFPSFFGTFFTAQFLLTLYYICIGFIVKEISFTEYFALEALFAFLILLTFTWRQKQLSVLRYQSKLFYRDRSIASFLGYSGFILGIYIVSEFGLLLSMIFSFLYIVFTMGFSFVFFRDIPRGRDIIFASVVTILVSLGFYNR